jgi:hypothetical protein
LLEANGFVAVDLNGDGEVDLVLAGGPGDGQQPEGMSVCLGNGDGTFQGAVGDGYLDLIFSYLSGGGASVYLGDGTGAFTYQATLLNSLGISGINMVADLNGDGIPDVAVLAADAMAIFLGQGDATYAAPFDVGTGPTPGSLLVANLHGQAASAGLPDVVAPDNSGGVIVLINKTK